MKAIILHRISEVNQTGKVIREWPLEELINAAIKDRHTIESLFTFHKDDLEKIREILQQIKDRALFTHQTVPVYAYQIDHFVRSFSSFLYEIHALIEMGEVEFHFIRDNYTINHNSSLTERFQWDVVSNFDKYNHRTDYEKGNNYEAK